MLLHPFGRYQKKKFVVKTKIICYNKTNITFYGCEIMAFEFRTGLFGFNKDDVMHYVHMKDHELKSLSKELNTQISELKEKLEALKEEHLSTVGELTQLIEENGSLKETVAEYDKKADEIDEMSARIGKLYLVSKTTAKTVVGKAQESSKLVEDETDRRLSNIETTQQSLKEIAGNILNTSQNFIKQIDELNDSLEEAKVKVEENKHSSKDVSREFAELYAKL